MLRYDDIIGSTIPLTFPIPTIASHHTTLVIRLVLAFNLLKHLSGRIIDAKVIVLLCQSYIGSFTNLQRIIQPTKITIRSITTELRTEMFQMNVSPQLFSTLFDFGADVAAYRFTPMFLQQLGMATDPYMNYVATADVPTMVSGNICIDPETYEMIELTDEQKQVLSSMWMLQYDRMYGDKYSLR